MRILECAGRCRRRRRYGLLNPNEKINKHDQIPSLLSHIRKYRLNAPRQLSRENSVETATMLWRDKRKNFHNSELCVSAVVNIYRRTKQFLMKEISFVRLLQKICRCMRIKVERFLALQSKTMLAISNQIGDCYKSRMSGIKTDTKILYHERWFFSRH